MGATAPGPPPGPPAGLPFETHPMRPVADTARPPERWVCRLDALTAGGGLRFQGTAWLIGPDLALTAGHCVYDAGGWVASRFRLTPGCRPDGSACAPVEVLREGHRVWVPDPWAASPSPPSPWDLAVLRLADPLPADFGAFELRGVTAAEADVEVAVSGYAVGQPSQQQTASARPDAVDGTWIRHRLSTDQGHSGAPLWRLVGQRACPVGLHVGWTTPGPLNLAILLTPDVVAALLAPH